MEKVTITIENADKTKSVVITVQDHPDNDGTIKINAMFEPAANVNDEDDFLNTAAMVLNALHDA